MIVQRRPLVLSWSFFWSVLQWSTDTATTSVKGALINFIPSQRRQKAERVCINALIEPLDGLFAACFASFSPWIELESHVLMSLPPQTVRAESHQCWGVSCSPATHFVLTGFVWFAATSLDKFALLITAGWCRNDPEVCSLGTGHLWGRTAYTLVAAEVLTFHFYFTLHWRHERGARARTEKTPLWKLVWKVLMMPYFRIY